MTDHRHAEYVPGCYRCELSRDEMVSCTHCRDDPPRGHVCPRCGVAWVRTT